MVIGLTGGIASGKSTVSRMLHGLGAVIIDADKVAREVVKPGEPAWEKIKERFGETVFHSNGELNRQALGAIVFNDDQARYELNAIIHPQIRRSMLAQKNEALANGHSLIVMDIPLLFESELEHMVEKVLVVYVPTHIQKERLMYRDKIEEDIALQKMRSQLCIEKKKHMGHAFIDNSGSLDETKKQLLKILNEWNVAIDKLIKNDNVTKKMGD